MDGGRGGRGRGRGGRGGRGGGRGGGSSSSTGGRGVGGGRGRGGGRGAGRGRGEGIGGKTGSGRGGGRSSTASSRDENTKPSSSDAAGDDNSDGKRKWSSDSTVRSKSSGQGGGRGRGQGRGGGRGGGGYKGRGSGSSSGGGGGGTGGGEEAGGPANKKRKLKFERQQHRPQFDTVLRSKEIWNKLRERKVPADERAKLVQELLELIKGKVMDIALKHDASRVVQTALQFGNREERLSILTEIEGHITELSQLTYGHFIVLRLFKEIKGPEEQKRVAKTFRGQTVRLATHAIGARVVQTALDSLPVASAALIKSEFYGKEFALFSDGDQPHSLKAVLEARPDRRAVVMAHVNGVIAKLLSKGLMQFEFAHDLLWEYMQEATPMQMQEVVPQLVESYMLLLSTRPGSMAAAMCAAHGGAKERKRMMRALKGYVAASLMHRDAYIAVVRLVESVDDTITCQKTILAELLKPVETPAASTSGSTIPKPGKGTSAEEWVPRGNTAPKGIPEEGIAASGEGDDGVSGMDVEEEGGAAEVEEEEAKKEEEEEAAPLALMSVMTHRNGCKLLLRLLAPDHTGYLHPEELELLKPTMVPSPAAAAAAKSSASGGATDAGARATEEATIPLVPSSKKEASVRRRELLAYLREPLKEACASHAGELMRSKFAGALVLLEAVRVIGTPQVVEAVADAACAKPLEMQLPMHEDPTGHLFMKQLLKREAEAQKENADGDAIAAAAATDKNGNSGAPWFADALLKRAGGELSSWALKNRGGFVVAALDEVPSASAGVRNVLGAKAAKARLVKDAKTGDSMGAKVLAEQLGFGDFGAKKAAEASAAKRAARK